ncbi:MAG: DUF2029 domain-containing protein [Cyanobacteria bacterium REEB67]|nr:DUF2029 domain-containing protein [Cyanobacteria bacterium REEB67]
MTADGIFWTRRTPQLAAFLWMLLLLTLIVGADLKAPQALVGNDYHTAFYVAGWMAAHGQLAELYPQAGATTFHGAPFDLTVHKMLPGVDSHVVGQFMYSPLVAYLFAPLSTFAPAIGQLIWQAFNFLLLALSCYFIADLTKSGRNVKKDFSVLALFALTILSASFFFLPIFNTLWLGQMDIALGLLPMAAGAWLLSRNKDLASGLVFSIVSLKPQFLPAVALICLGLLLHKRWQMLVGLVLGVAAIVGLSYATAGATIVHNWFSSLKISEGMFTGEFRNPDYLAGCLPLSILITASPADRLNLKPVAYLVTAIGLFANIAMVVWLSRRKFEPEIWLRLLIVVSVLPIFVYSPRLLTYDWSLLLLPISVSLYAGKSDRLVTGLLLALALLVDIEVVLQFTATTYVCPLLLTGPGTLLAVAIVVMSLDFKSSKS